MMNKKIIFKTSAQAASDGDGVQLKRVIGTQQLNYLDPFLLLDEFGSDRPLDYIGGFPDHPHRGFETVTYMLAGKMRHKDSAGHSGVIETGDVQWMTAGRGIIHSEMPEQTQGMLAGLQLWVNLPAQYKMTEPKYQEYSAEQIPEETRDNNVRLKVIAGQTQNCTKGVINNNFVNPNYTVPLNESGTTLGLSYIYSDHQLGGALTALNAGGNSHMATADMLHTLFRSRMAHFYAGAGLDFRFFKNFLQNQTSTDDVLFNAHLFAGGNIRDTLMGQTFLHGRLQFGYTETDQGDPLNSRLQGQGDAVVATFSLTRYQSAYFGGSYFIMKFNGQVTDKRVLSPDQFVLGGIGTVRGYPLADASGDHGYQTTLEYVLPLPIDFPVTTNPRYTFPDLFSLFGFIDHGRIFIEEPQPAERNVSLTSVGGGVRLSVPKGKGHLPGADFSLTYAIPVLGDRKPSDGSLGMVHVAGRLFF